MSRSDRTGQPNAGKSAPMSLMLQTFMDRLQKAADTDAFSRAMAGIADALGFTKFGYLGLPRPAPHLPVYVTNYPLEWVSHYASRRYQDIDPVVVRAHAGLLPFIWEGANPGVHASDEQRRMFGEAGEFGINGGFAVPIHDTQGGVAVVSFSTDQKPQVLRRTVQEHRDILHLASIYFHAHARQKLEQVVVPERPHLSAREIACLQWVVRGKSTWDIGEILTISRRTVVFHLENAKRKLNAVTLPQAVSIALQNRLIEF